jgi:DNA-binding NtrC family response regulator
MDRPRVLVIEDRPSVLKMLATLLASAYEVTTASEATAGIALIGSVPFQVVLTDVRMPGVSGFEVLRAARSCARSSAVVMMTAYANVTDAVAAIKLGAFDYVPKPIDADGLALVVARAVEHVRDIAGPCEEVAPRSDDRRAAEEASEICSVEFHRAVEEARDRASRTYLVNLMRHFHGNVTNAAERAGMTRESLYRVLKKYEVRSEFYRDQPVDGGYSN